MIRRISIELTNRCSKACSFCYNASGPDGAAQWTADEVVAFVADCARSGVRAVSFGGGEPLEFDGVFDILTRLRGTIFRSLTTNGLPLDRGALRPLVDAAPDKVHVSLHYPQCRAEVARVVRQVKLLEEHGVVAGVNLLVSATQLGAAAEAAEALTDAGIDAVRIVYLPMRGGDTPSADEVGQVATTGEFQSMSCLSECAASSRFCSIRWDKTVAWCSYTATRRPLSELTYGGLCRAMSGLGLAPCDPSTPAPVDDQSDRAVVAAGAQADAFDVQGVVDYPAAHSMDTEWFATDRNGHVAILDASEPGPVPRVFIEQGGHESTFFDVLPLLLNPTAGNTLRFDLADLIELGPGRLYGPLAHNASPDTPLLDRAATLDVLKDWDPPPDAAPAGGILGRLLNWTHRQRDQRSPRTVDAICWLKDESALGQLADARALPVEGRIVVWVESCPVATLRRLFDEGLILSIMIEEMSPSPHRFGFFQYLCDEYDGGPYDRLAVPRNPLHIDQLAGNVRELCSRVELRSVDFREALRLQPAEYVPCEMWGDSWVDLQGNVHSNDADGPAQ